MNFLKTLQEIRTLDIALRKKQDAVNKTKQKLEGKVLAVIDACWPACIKAINRYNSSELLLIIAEDSQISFSLKDRKLRLRACLRYGADGREPDEDLDHEDVNKIRLKLAPIIERELISANIPFTFGDLFVPPDYYGK